MFGIERGKSGSIVVWLILGVLALAFGLTFGLPSDQLSMGESGLVKVHGENVTKEDYAYQQRAIITILGGLPEGKQAQAMGVREEILEAVIERLVLADAGKDLGLEAEIRDAELQIRDGYHIVLGYDVPFPWANGSFDYKAFQAELRGRFLVSEARYLEIQREEIIASQVRDLILASVAVPEPEVWAAYEQENNQLSLRYVELKFADYAELVDPTTEEVDAWMLEHEDELGEMVERDAARFLKLPAEVDLRFIEVSKPVQPPESAGAEVRALYEANLAGARAKIDAARKAITEGGESFASVARNVSDDVDTQRSGGYYGWAQITTETGSGLDPAIDEAAKTLEDGQVSEVVETDGAYYLVLVAGHREGDVPEDLIRRELAYEAVRKARGRELAQQAADEALLAMREGKDLDDVFASAPVLGGEGEGEGENIEDYAIVPRDLTPRYDVDETGLFSYGGTIPGIGTNPKLTIAAWDASAESPNLDQAFDVPGGLLLASVAERQEATREGYAEDRAKHYEKLAFQRGTQMITAFTRRRCYVGKAKVDIRTNDKLVDALMTYEEPMVDPETGVPLTPPYEVCARVGDRGGLLQLARLGGAVAP